MISAAAVLAPLLVEVALTLALLFWGGGLRFVAVQMGGADRDAAFRDTLATPELARLGDAVRAELELPALFYLIVVLTQLTATVSVLFVALFWVFVVTRLAHALIHVTTNDRARRFMLYWAGALVLALTWLIFAVKILAGV